MTIKFEELGEKTAPHLTVTDLVPGETFRFLGNQRIFMVTDLPSNAGARSIVTLDTGRMSMIKENQEAHILLVDVAATWNDIKLVGLNTFQRIEDDV